MAPKYVLVPHRVNVFIVNVQPSFPATTVPVRVQHIDCIVPVACGPPVVVKYSIEFIVHRLRKFTGNGGYYFWTNRAGKDSQHLANMGKSDEKIVPSGISSSGVN
jgi:hypothetical protein